MARNLGDFGKFEAVVKAFPVAWHEKILDVGCRSRHLEGLIPDQTSYFGLDLAPPSDVIGNLESGLPFGNEEFYTVVALDVLEHTNNFHFAFTELCRVSRRYVIISLPNAYDIKARLRFLLGKPISGKYGLPVNYQLDRHRWLFSLNDASKFFQTVSLEYGFHLQREGVLIGAKRPRILVKRYPNLLSSTYLALLVKDVSS